MTEAQYFGTIPTFLSKGTNEILGEIFSGEQFDATIKTREAWLSEIDIMRETLTQYMQEPTSLIFFEYTIPRVGGRMDCGVILSGQEMPTADIALFSRKCCQQNLFSFSVLLLH